MIGATMGVREAGLELFVLTPLGEGEFELGGVVGEEAISRPFRFHLDLFTKRDEVRAESIVGQQITFGWIGGQSADGEGIVRAADGRLWRQFNGIVCELNYCETQDRWHRYEVEVVPAHWLLSRRRDCRIFQTSEGKGGSVPEIVTAVLDEAGLQAPDLSALQDSYRQREYCVQYRETDLDFVSRLLEDEGIWYRFRHRDGRHELVLADSRGGYVESGDPELNVPTRTNAPERDDLILSWRRRHEIRSGRWAHTDYNFTDPKAALAAQQRAGTEFPLAGALEEFEYPGGYGDRTEGERRARIRIEEEESRWERVTGQSIAAGLSAGSCFRVGRHPLRDERGRQWLVTEVRHQIPMRWPGQMEDSAATDEIAGQRYRNSFECIPADLEFRPPLVTPRPSVQGIQTAVVVGPAKDEIFVDEYARVKVQFHWDRRGRRDEHSSCWIRVAQPWAGAGYGGLCIPRIGQEVVVEFEEGDPDRPLINGRLYNRDQMPPVSNAGREVAAARAEKSEAKAAQKGKAGKNKKKKDSALPSPESVKQAAMMTSLRSQSLGGSGGSNEITMNDTGGAEGLFIKAQKDEVHTVGNDRVDQVGNDETLDVTNDRTRTVGNDESVEVGNDQEITVDNNQTLKVGVDQSIDVGANQTINVGANRSLTVGMNEMHTVKMCRAQSTLVSENILTGVSKSVQTGLAHIETIGMLQLMMVGLKRIGVVGMSDTLIVGQNKTDDIKGELSVSSGKSTTISATEDFIVEAENNVGLKAADTLVVECPDITIKAAGGFIRINGDGIYLKGAKVFINSGGATKALDGSESTPDYSSTGSDGSSSSSTADSAPAPASGSDSAPPTSSANIPSDGTPGQSLVGGGCVGPLGAGTSGIPSLGDLGGIIGQIPGLDPNVGNVLAGLMNGQVPDLTQVLNALKPYLPDKANEYIDGVTQAINQYNAPPPSPESIRPAGYDDVAVTDNGATGGGSPNYAVDPSQLDPNQSTNSSSDAATSVTNSKFDPDAASAHASAHALSAPSGQCGKYTREAIEAGGIKLDRVPHAKDYGPSLEKAGFQKIPATESTYVPQKGDVVVFQPTSKSPSGHMQIHDGTQFVSDFKQKDPLWPSSSPDSAWKTEKPSFTVYRFPSG